MARTDRQPRTRLDPDARRAAILAAATDAFGARPYPEVTIATIADTVGASEALVYRYFAGKEGLYAAVVEQSLRALQDQQADAVAALPPGAPVRDRVRVTIEAQLDHIAAHPASWAGALGRTGAEPAAVTTLRLETRRAQVDRLRRLLSPSTQVRHDYTLWGFLGLLEAACRRWVEQGCPPEHRWPLIDAALGALEGGLGDWSA